MHLETRMENDVIDKIRALYDAREVQNDNAERIFRELSDINNNLDYALLKLVKHEAKLTNVNKIS